MPWEPRRARRTCSSRTEASKGLDLMGRVFLNEGDAVLVEAPAYYGALNAFAAYRPESWASPWTTRAWTPRRRGRF
jgi:DNA-binding transcriptional MocR family regulator